MSGLCRLKCFAWQTSSHPCLVVCRNRSSFFFLAPRLIEETFLLEVYRNASERQELAHDCRCPHVSCPEPEVSDLDFECQCIRAFACSCGALFVDGAPTCGEPTTLCVHRVRLSHSNDVRGEKLNVAQSRVPDRRVVSR